MSERKVLNKYYPPSFDPAAIKRRKLGADRQQVVRLMAPFSMQCRACHEFIYKGKKFNARKETAQGEVYFGIKIFRFYIKCPRCSNEITFKTDPKNTDYVAEHGAQRNFEPWREEEARPAPGGDTEDDLARLEAAELEAEEEDAMKALENRQMDSKREMDILDKLQEIRTRNARMERADADAILKTVSSRVDSGATTLEEREAAARRQKEVEEDEEEVRRYFAKMQQDLQMEPIGDVDDDGPVASGSETPPPASTTAIKRKLDEAEPEARSLLSEDARKVAAMDFSTVAKKKPKPATVGGVKFGIKVVKKAKQA